ncbi:MAG: cupin [Desulfatitalea sp. BRH_c12]|nr:MAG: cupin [Desulfatitalea sp. BRH_c12]
MSTFSVRKWSHDHPPAPQAIEENMRAEGVACYRWSNDPGDIYGAHDHTYDKIIYVLQGSITFGLPQRGEKIVLGAGDRLYLPAGITHDAVVGREGVVCLEGHRPVR